MKPTMIKSEKSNWILELKLRLRLLLTSLRTVSIEWMGQNVDFGGFETHQKKSEKLISNIKQSKNNILKLSFQWICE